MGALITAEGFTLYRETLPGFTAEYQRASPFGIHSICILHIAKLHDPLDSIISSRPQIDGEYPLSQRTGFASARFQDLPGRKNRTSPFRNP